jgi:hypothetical protein
MEDTMKEKAPISTQLSTSPRLLPNEKVNQVWRSGFCKEIVVFVAQTEDSPEGSKQRVVYPERHIRSSRDCRFANELIRSPALSTKLAKVPTSFPARSRYPVGSRPVLASPSPPKVAMMKAAEQTR